MIFYSDDITNAIIDNEPIENILDELHDFKAQLKYSVLLNVGYSVGPEYVETLFHDERIKAAFYCFDDEFCIANCPTIMLYRKQVTSSEIVYYILLMCTKRRFKGQGFASKLLDGFIERVKMQGAKANSAKTVKIALSSVETAVTFYEEYGFRWTRKHLREYPLLMQYEKCEEDKEYFMMELVL
jgi:ribosomal protein S18 acetylase RimI-like enzyme